MAHASSSPPGIFISYRRGDSGGYARALYERLSARFGDEHVFMDVGHIPPGADFKQVIENAIGSCEVLIALIGQDWAGGQGGGARRLDDPKDFVRLEVAAALARGVRVIPVLVQGAPVPRPQELPEDLAPLSGRHAHELSDSRWDYDVDRLVAALEKVVAGVSAPRPKVRPWTVFAAATLACVLIGIVIVAAQWRQDGNANSNANGVNNNTNVNGDGGGVSTPVPQPSSAVPEQLTPTPGTGQPPPPTQTPPPVVKHPDQNAAGIQFLLVYAGTFTMGSNGGEDDQKPPHTVTIRESFYLGKYEVTQAQWRVVMGYNPLPRDCPDCPVAGVSWGDAKEFIDRLNAQNGPYKYRLPTEAEWEYACRAGVSGDSAPNFDATAWYRSNAGGEAHPVGKKQPNAFGFHDMSGNVFEWCEDWHRVYEGGNLALAHPDAKVMRGGSWDSIANYLRPSYRGWRNPNDKIDLVGFRVAAVAR